MRMIKWISENISNDHKQNGEKNVLRIGVAPIK